jgi:hypothetical protein
MSGEITNDEMEEMGSKKDENMSIAFTAKVRLNDLPTS